MKQILYSLLIFNLFAIGLCAQKAKRTISQTQKQITKEDRAKLKPFKVNAQRKNVASYPSYSNLDFSKLNGKTFKILHQDAEKNVSWMKGDVDQSALKTWEEKAALWNSKANGFLDLNDKINSFAINKIWTDQIGYTHIKMNQLHNGIKVYGSEIILHAEDKTITHQNGQYVKSNLLPSEKSQVLSINDVKERVKKDLKNFRTDINQLKGLNVKLDVEQWQEELVYYKNGADYTLAYHIEVYPNLGEHFSYIIDASTSEVLEKYSTICTAHHHNGEACNHDHDPLTKGEPHTSKMLNGSVAAQGSDLLGQNRNFSAYEFNDDYFLIDASRQMFSNQSQMPDDPVGVIWTINMNNTSPVSGGTYTHVANTVNNWSNTPEGISAHFNAGKAYDYFKEVHNRESISGTGQNIVSFVNVAGEDGNSMGNAFWNGVGIYYGNGDDQFRELGRGLDVAGHEMTHGVIQATADLQYFGESGAINESMADVFGAMIDREDWLIGEDVMRFGGALRSMSDPHNGAQNGDFFGGWQPRHFNERYTGSEDNGGVHINSGIPNYAYYLFATEVGREVAENVYYHALTNYLTRSTQFQDLRFAVVKSSEVLYGQATVNQARAAFDQVGITVESQGDYEQEFEANPGQDLLLFADPELSNSYVINLTDGSTVFNPLSTTDILSKPSITDDGSRIVFVGTDNHIHLIDINWSVNPPTAEENIVSQNAEWANIIISKDGTRIAGLLDLIEPLSDPLNKSIWVNDLISQTSQFYELYNPTFTDGIQTGEVVYADALEFDATGNRIMFDALNRFQVSTGEIEFWDIGFLEVWNQAANTWALGRVDKLFGSLPEGISVGNPTFSKNSPSIIAFDYIENDLNQIIGVNLETNDVGELFESTDLGYPNYSRDDRFLVYDLNIFDPTEIGILELEADKINIKPNTDNFLFENATPSKWPIWFSNGDRIIADVEEIVAPESVLTLSPNPAFDQLNVELINVDIERDLNVEITDITGQLISNQKVDKSNLQNLNINVSDLNSGIYILNIRSKTKLISQKFIKQ